MSFLEHECNISLAAALAFLDETLDASETPQLSSLAPTPFVSPLSSTTPSTAAPELLLEALDSDIGDFATQSPLTRLAANTAVPRHLQLESKSLSSQHTTLVPVPSSKQLKSPMKKKLNYDPNKARNERRFELACLRKEAKDLELTLEQLQSMQDKEKVSPIAKRPRPVARPVTAGSGMSAVWEQICAHQLERRLRVERENIHLKMMHKSQVQVAKSIERLLQKRLALQDTTYSEISKHTSRIEVPQGYTTDADQKIFEELSIGVEVSYQEVDAVFDAHGPEDTHLPTREPLLRDSVNGKYMELFDNKIMPFDMRSTGDAWWRRWHNYKGHCAHENGPNNTIVEKFGLEMKDVKTRTTATFYVQQILRRHVEDGRIVILWHAHIKPLEFDQKAATGVHYLEKGYVLVKPHIVQSRTNRNEDATRVMTCYIITPHLADRKLRTDARTTALTEFVLSATSANISMSNEMIENLLVDRALKKQARE
ncbi:M96 mating-specific protein [Phytophthora megakarya]|uniref:M96 mating-specific protein n=1 Tax=Phytophthora megakarya TaxID=4795 RepID=A0A225VKA5_9STRA|nr:M96 mating-specific protein [Phytophthora megakarya]